MAVNLINTEKRRRPPALRECFRRVNDPDNPDISPDTNGHHENPESAPHTAPNITNIIDNLSVLSSTPRNLS